MALLDRTAERQEGRRLRRVRFQLFRLRPTPVRAWRWLRAAVETAGSG